MDVLCSSSFSLGMEQRVVSSEEAFDELSGEARYLCAEHKLDRHKQEGILASSFER